MAAELDWFLDLSGEDAVAVPSNSAQPASASVAALRPGERFADRYQVVEALGSGAMGVVYHARELSSGRSVAIKLLRGSVGAKRRERFRREGEVTAALRHPGVVAIYAAGEAGGVPYLVYEFVEGGRTLRDLLDEGAPRARLLQALLEAAEALGAAHADGLVHRDVKPENVLVTPTGRVRVADFGLAFGVTLEALTKSGEVLGTPRYMSPEQLGGERDEVGPAADVWALGVILHEIVSGELPFQAETLVELIGEVLHPQVDPRRLAPDLEPGLEAICLRALQRERSERYAHGAAFAADLGRFLGGEDPEALGRRTQSRPFAWVVLGLVVVLVAGAGVWGGERLFRGESLSRAVAGFEGGQLDSDALEAALDANPGAPPEVRATAHLRLAAGAEGDAQAWERRLAHAEAATALSREFPAPRASLAWERRLLGRRLRARALVELGRYAEARATYEEAHVLGAEPEHTLEGMRLLADCSRWEEVRALLRLKPGVPETSAQRQLGVQVAIGLGDGAVALAQERARLDAGAIALLEARLAQVSGGDAVNSLRRKAQARSGDADLRQALLRLHLERAELAEALELSRHAPAGVGPALRALSRWELADAAWRLPRSWKLSLGRCLTKLARRELDLARQTEDPRYESPAKALAPSERRARAERCLAFVRAELEADRLWAARVEAPGSARSLLRRARELLDGGDVPACLEALEDYAQCDDYDLGPYDVLQGLIQDLSAASADAGERLRTLFALHGGEELSEVAPGSEEPPREAAPYDYNARYRRAAPLLRTQPERCLRTWVLVASRAPRLLVNLESDLFRLTRSDQLVGRRATLRPLLARLKGAGWLGRLTRGALEAQAVEREGGAPTAPSLDRILDECPGATFARVLRAFVLIRGGRTQAAREELAIVREASPGLRSTAFVAVLLLAKEGATSEEVLAALRAAKARGFRVGAFWRDDDYPELGPYLGDPQIRALLTMRKERRVQRRR